MEIKLYQNDSIRASTDGGDNFIDIKGMYWQSGIQVSLYPSFHYIEMREKNRQVAVFLFKNKGIKKDIDLGWWDDAKVIFAMNKVNL